MLRSSLRAHKCTPACCAFFLSVAQEPSSTGFLQALRAENEQLRQRLTAVEGAAADALGELEDLQVRISA